MQQLIISETGLSGCDTALSSRQTGFFIKGIIMEEEIKEFLEQSKEGKELAESVLDEEIGRTKLALGWLMVETDDCFERAIIIDILKKRFDKLNNKLKVKDIEKSVENAINKELK